MTDRPRLFPVLSREQLFCSVRFFGIAFFRRAASLLLLLVYFKYCRPLVKAFPIDRAEPFVTFDPFFVWHRFSSSKVKPGRVNHSLLRP
jgi:hypothetical protein